MITEIEIKEVKGISDKLFKQNIIPNKPNLFVAPNGFGKSSIAIGFESLKRTGIDLEDEDKYRGLEDASPEISLKLKDGTRLTATSNSNKIFNEFSVFVINSQLYSEATVRNFGGYANASSSISVKPITLVNTIPDKKEMTYGYRKMKRRFNDCAKLFINFTELLKDEEVILKMNDIKDSLEKMFLVRRGNKKDKFVEYINGFSGTKNELKSAINDFSIIEEIDVMDDIINFLTTVLPKRTSSEKYVNAIQLICIYKDNKEQFTEIVKYYSYIYDKKKFTEKINSFDTTWKSINTKEKKNQLILELPPAKEISNGERDILTFLGKLFEAQRKLRKKKCILIIDEIFDYLDDGNLIAAQYFINEFITEFKEEGKELYPIILTHLDPQYFRTYRFKLKNIHYLDKTIDNVNLYKVNKLLKNRNKLPNKIDKYFLHFHPDTISAEDILNEIGVNSQLYNADDFREIACEELGKYKKNKRYDIPFVCCGIRIKIEEKIYNKLTNEYKSEFLNIHGTNNKLDFAEEKGVNILEKYYLLGIIYNEALHMDSQCKEIIPVGIKLRHPVIKKMISSL